MSIDEFQIFSEAKDKVIDAYDNHMNPLEEDFTEEVNQLRDKYRKELHTVMNRMENEVLVKLSQKG